MGKVKWVRPKDYSSWAMSSRTTDTVSWVGIVYYHVGGRKVVIRALQRSNVLLITVSEKNNRDTKWQYNGSPRIKITCSGEVHFPRYEDIQLACEQAMKRYVIEFMQVKDIEKT